MFDFLTIFAACQQNKAAFGIFPPWYKYLSFSSDCTVEISSIYDIFRILAAVLELLLRLGGVLAVVFIIIGGIRFITSLGNPEAIKGARDMIINALVGLVLIVLSTTIVSFIAGRF